MSQKIFKFVYLAYLFAFSSCGPTVNVSPEFDNEPHNIVAILPIIAPKDIRKERVDYLKSTLKSELKNSGYSVVSKEVVEKACINPDQCRQNLFAIPTLTTLVQMEIDSLSRNNFGLGFYNTISGRIKFINQKNQEILSIEHRESERGGIVFESGQIIEAIENQYQNFGDETFNRLSDKFVKSIIAEAPSEVKNQPLVTPLVVKNIEVITKNPSVYQICSEATPGISASLRIQKRSSTLREITPGKYCGVFNLPPYAATGLELEVRSAFDEVSRATVALPQISVCSLDGKLRILEETDGNRIFIDCPEMSVGCLEDKSLGCSVKKILLYRASSEVGPYTKIAEITTGNWLDKIQKIKNTNTIYQAVALGEQGQFSAPVKIERIKQGLGN